MDYTLFLEAYRAVLNEDQSHSTFSTFPSKALLVGTKSLEDYGGISPEVIAKLIKLEADKTAVTVTALAVDTGKDNPAYYDITLPDGEEVEAISALHLKRV